MLLGLLWIAAGTLLLSIHRQHTIERFDMPTSFYVTCITIGMAFLISEAISLTIGGLIFVLSPLIPISNLWRLQRDKRHDPT